MEETKTSCDNVVTEKIKAFDPRIVVNKADIEPYYMIHYYDASDKKWHLGYGSFNLSLVREWLRDEFEEVEVELAEVKHGEWAWIADDSPMCTYCGKVFDTTDNVDAGITWRHCPNCGAKMGGQF